MAGQPLFALVRRACALLAHPGRVAGSRVASAQFLSESGDELHLTYGIGDKASMRTSLRVETVYRLLADTGNGEQSYPMWHLGSSSSYNPTLTLIEVSSRIPCARHLA